MQENRGTRAQPRRTRACVQGETEKGRASKRNKAAAIFVRERLAHQVGRGAKREQNRVSGEREREKEQSRGINKEGRNTGGRLVADDDDNVSLTWFGLPVDIEPGNQEDL